MRSGLQEYLNTSYAENAVVHMLTGKAISRTIHDHLQLGHIFKVEINSEITSESTDPDFINTPWGSHVW